jgi:hypothetical protein
VVNSVQVKVNPSAVYAELEDGAVILNVDTGTYFGLDRVGSRIWALVGDGSTTEAIVDQLEREYAADRTRLQEDVAGYLRLLEDKGLLKVAVA